MLVLVRVVYASMLMTVMLSKVNYSVIVSLHMLQMTLHIIVMHVYMYILYKAMTWPRNYVTVKLPSY